MELRALFFFTASLLPPSSILSAVVHSSSAGGGDLGFCTNHQQGAGHHHQQDRMAALGGVQDPRGTENHTSVKDFARFAIDEHNKKDWDFACFKLSADASSSELFSLTGVFWLKNALLEFARVVKVQDAADHAIETIQQRSNSVFPYELYEIIHAKGNIASATNPSDLVDGDIRGRRRSSLGGGGPGASHHQLDLPLSLIPFSEYVPRF
ncbi:hypothetical protein CRG98_018802 [Punica granatum]|uniref:Uncharacterized protein n=1 Tax=Punica granatum TaxID=22663 RepID=A0A2I0JYB5_PUNGR|nr:hypothetical protein CRG98_018802 [Punica granatum]